MHIFAVVWRAAETKKNKKKTPLQNHHQDLNGVCVHEDVYVLPTLFARGAAVNPADLPIRPTHSLSHPADFPITPTQPHMTVIRPMFLLQSTDVHDVLIIYNYQTPVINQ